MFQSRWLSGGSTYRRSTRSRPRIWAHIKAHKTGRSNEAFQGDCRRSKPKSVTWVLLPCMPIDAQGSLAEKSVVLFKALLLLSQTMNSAVAFGTGLNEVCSHSCSLLQLWLQTDPTMRIFHSGERLSIRALHSPPGLCQWASLYLHPEHGHSFCLFFFPENTDISHSEWEGQMTSHVIWELERIKIPCHTSQYLQDWLARQDSVTPGPQGVPDYSRLGTTYFSLDYYRQEYRYGEEQSLNSECEINLASDSSLHPNILHLPFHHHQEREEEAGAQGRKYY